MSNHLSVLLIFASVLVVLFLSVVLFAQTPITNLSTCTSTQAATVTSSGIQCVELKDVIKNTFPCSAGQVLRLSSSGYLRCGDNSATAPSGSSITGNNTKKTDLTCRSNQLLTASKSGIECRNIGHILHALLTSCTSGDVLKAQQQQSSPLYRLCRHPFRGFCRHRIRFIHEYGRGLRRASGAHSHHKRAGM